MVISLLTPNDFDASYLLYKIILTVVFYYGLTLYVKNRKWKIMAIAFNNSLKKTCFLLIIGFAISCQKKQQTELLYNELINYRNDLRATLHAQSVYAEIKSENDSNQKKLFQKVDLIEKQINYAFQKNRYGNRPKVILIRDSLNSKYKANLKYNDLNSLATVEDSIFHKLIEIDFLRLRKHIQNTEMFRNHSDK